MVVMRINNNGRSAYGYGKAWEFQKNKIIPHADHKAIVSSIDVMKYLEIKKVTA